jgi:hypothetical protein
VHDGGEALRDDADAERHVAGDRACDPAPAIRAAGEDARPRRGRVELQPRADRHRASAAAQAHAHAVATLGRPATLVGAAVPGHRDGAPRDRRNGIGEPLDLVAGLVDDRDRHVVVLAHAHLDPADVAAPVAVGREVPRQLVDGRDLRRALEPLGDEEARERRGHEQDEDGAREEAHRRG